MRCRLAIALLAVALAACGDAGPVASEPDSDTQPAPAELAEESPVTTVADDNVSDEGADGASEPAEADPGDTDTSASAESSGGDGGVVEQAPVTTVPHGSEGGVPDNIVATAVADAATRAGVEAASVTVVEAYQTDWPDSSLGCPSPGMAYTQVITPGYHVVLEAAGRQFDYRMTTVGGFKLCDHTEGLYVPDPPDKSGTVPEPPPPGDS